MAVPLRLRRTRSHGVPPRLRRGRPDPGAVHNATARPTSQPRLRRDPAAPNPEWHVRPQPAQVPGGAGDDRAARGAGRIGPFDPVPRFRRVRPAAHRVSEDTVLSLTAWHYWLSRAILAVTVLHVTVIRFYLVWKRENPITPMITGWKWVKRDSHTDEHTRRADAGFVHHCQPTSPSVMPRTTPSTRRRRPSSGAARPVLLQACPHLYVASRNGFCASARPPRDKKNRNQALA